VGRSEGLGDEVFSQWGLAGCYCPALVCVGGGAVVCVCAWAHWVGL